MRTICWSNDVAEARDGDRDKSRAVWRYNQSVNESFTQI